MYSDPPFFLAFSREPRLLIESQLPVGVETHQSDEEVLNRKIEHHDPPPLFNVQTVAMQTIGKTQARQKQYFDTAHAAPNYKVGNFVLLNNARRNTRKGDKLCPRWSTKP